MMALREKSPLAMLSRWRVTSPDDAGIGAASHRFAQATSPRSSPGGSPARGSAWDTHARLACRDAHWSRIHRARAARPSRTTRGPALVARRAAPTRSTA